MTEKQRTEENKEKTGSRPEQPAAKKTAAVRILSLFLVILLSCLLLLTLFVALFGGQGSEKLLMILIVLDVIIPVVLYGYLHFIRGMKR